MNQGLTFSVNASNRLRTAYSIIDGIPAKNIWLGMWEKRKNEDLTKAVRCPGLWLLTHPQFPAILGNKAMDEALYMEQGVEDMVPVHAQLGKRRYGSLLLANVLFISPQESALLFRKLSGKEIDSHLPDKDLFLARLERLIDKLDNVQLKMPYVHMGQLKKDLGLIKPMLPQASNTDRYNLAA